MALTYNSLLASTIKHYKKGFVDNIISDFILLAALGQKDLAANVFKMRTPEGDFAEGIKLVDGGEKIFMPIMQAKNLTVAGYSGYDTLDINPTDPFTAAEYDWKSIAGSVNMDNERLDKNRGDAVKLFDLMKGMMDNLKVSTQEKINKMLLSSKGAGTKEPNGVLDLIQDDPTVSPVSGNIGGIDASIASGAFWRNQMVNQNSVAFGTDQTGAGSANLRKLIRNCTFGVERPNLIVAGEQAFEVLENALLQQNRFLAPVAKQEELLANAGFQVIMFKGIPVVMEKTIDTVRSDAALTGSAFYAVNTKYLKLYGMKHRWFEPSNVKEPVNQDTQVMHIITRCQFVTDNRRSLGVLKAVV